MQNYPKLSGLSLEVTEMKKGNKENLEYINEEEKINTQLKSNDIIYFDLDLKEVWLTINLLLKEENALNNNNKEKKEINSLFNLDLKIPIEMSQEDLNNKLINISLDFLEFRDDSISEEFEYKNENRDIEENDNIDYFFLTKFNVIIESTDLDANNNSKRKRAKTMRRERDMFINLNYNSNIKNSRTPRFSTKNLVEMVNLDNIETSPKLNKQNSINSTNEIKGPIINDIRGSNKIDEKMIKFNIDNRVNCTVSYINFSNYVLKDETFYRPSDFPDIKKLFNHKFADFYKSINLGKKNKLCKGQKLLYLQKVERFSFGLISERTININNFVNNNNAINNNNNKINNNNINNNNDNNIYLDLIKKIDYVRKINELEEYLLKEDFVREKIEVEYIRINKDVNNKENNIIKEKSNEEENDNDNTEGENSFINEDNNNFYFTKKGIFIMVGVILFIIILFKIL